MISRRITAVFINDPHTSAWVGYEENGVIRFDFTNNRGPRRFLVMPKHCVMFADESHLPMTVATGTCIWSTLPRTMWPRASD